MTKDHKVDLPPHKASFRVFFDCEFNVNPGYNSMQLLTTIKQHVSSTRGVIGQECTPETYPHRTIFTGMVMDKVHRDDEANLQNAQRLRDFAAHFRPGYRVVVSPGAGFGRSRRTAGERASRKHGEAVERCTSEGREMKKDWERMERVLVELAKLGGAVTKTGERMEGHATKCL